VVDDTSPAIPSQISLLPNYPNPFNSSTLIRFVTVGNAKVAVDILDILGRKIATLTNDVYQPGEHTIRWDGINCKGQTVSSGQYYVRIQSGDVSRTRAVMLLR
jgi:flagellar hook assembly protein FlgD